MRLLTLTAFLFSALISLFSVDNAQAAKFTNQFIEFELPLKWNCALEGAEWVCQGSDENKKKDAIIVLAAKLKGDQDGLEIYQDYLNKSRTFTGPNGKPMSSQPKYAKVIQLNGHPWVDSIHLESEIPGFFTRYLATLKNDIAVLVTYSINKGKYQDYLPVFEEMVKSMKVFRKAGGVNTNVAKSLFESTSLPGSFTNSQVFPEDTAKPAETVQDKPAKKEKADDNMMLYLIVAAAVIGFIIIKKRKGNS